MEKKNPIPQGRYVPATRWGDIIFTAGMTPRKNGVMVMAGKVLCEAEPSSYKDAVEQAADNAVTAAMNMLSDGEHIEKILAMNVFINAEVGYTKQAKIADIASEYICNMLGECGIGSRAAIGVASLPGDAPVEINITAGVGR